MDKVKKKKSTGQKLIKSMGILLIISAVFMLISGFSLYRIGELYFSTPTTEADAQALVNGKAMLSSMGIGMEMMKFLTGLGVEMLGKGALALIVGILGLVFYKKNGKAKIVMILGIVLTVVLVVFTAKGIIVGGYGVTLIAFFNMVAIVIAGFFFLGAKLNYDDAKELQAVTTTNAENVEEIKAKEKDQ